MVFLVATVIFGGFYRHVSTHQLIEQSERANVALTRAFANALWSDFRGHVKQAGGLNGEELRAHPNTARLRATVQEQMRGLSVLKVKIYNLSGLTVFSTEPSQMGALKTNNQGYLTAMRGRVISELSFRDTFYSLEGTISDRDIVSSYIPMRTSGGDIEGVFEIYDDVTESLESVENRQWTAFGLIGFVLVFIFGTLSAVVARGEALAVLTATEGDHSIKTKGSGSQHAAEDGGLVDQADRVVSCDRPPET